MQGNISFLTATYNTFGIKGNTAGWLMGSNHNGGLPNTLVETSFKFVGS